MRTVLGVSPPLTSHMGNVVQKYEYDSFGNMSLKPHWIKQPFTYTAREFDPETGLYYYRARYYDAKVGRFITKDPIGFRGGINQYVYVSNNPITYIDPTGLFSNHYWLSLRAFMREPCDELLYTASNAAQAVDSLPGSTAAENAFWHAMSNGLINESPSSAAGKTNSYINYQLSLCNAVGLGYALHAEQDKYAGGHIGYQPWYGQTLPSLEHWRADTYHSDTPGAINASINLIKRFKEQCPCVCEK